MNEKEMLLIKVVVSKMPRSCKECIFCINEARYGEQYSGWICSIQDVGIDDINAKPKWCPLVTYDECFDRMFFERPTTHHIKMVIEGKYKLSDFLLKRESESEE